MSCRPSTFLQLLFHNVSDLMDVRKDIMDALKTNSQTTLSPTLSSPSRSALEDNTLTEDDMALHSRLLSEDPLSQVTDIREYDVPYLARVCIDLNIRIGCWYDVSSDRGVISVTRQEHILTPSNAKVFAFDIECSKAPLKFPDASVDAIYMISIMIDGRGILIINREIVSKDIEDFE